jgi:hypothetical protein
LLVDLDSDPQSQYGSGSTSTLIWAPFSSPDADLKKYCVNLVFSRREDEDDSPGPQEIPQLDGGDTDDSEEEEEPADDSEDEDFVPSTSAARASTSRRADRTERSAQRSLARYRTVLLSSLANTNLQLCTVPVPVSI